MSDIIITSQSPTGQVVTNNNPSRASLLFVTPSEKSGVRRSQILSGQQNTPLIGPSGESVSVKDLEKLSVPRGGGADCADYGAGERSQESEADRTISINQYHIASSDEQPASASDCFK